MMELSVYDTELGQIATVWLARASSAAYLLALTLMIQRSRRTARIAWTAGLAIYLLHVCAAFEYFYSWSHAVAYRETARQTANLFGVNSGAGLYLNYAFTAVWLADCAWWWLKPLNYRSRSVTLSAGVHTFLAFMFLNATVVVWLLRSRAT
jgi:hypothetical protein